MLVEDPKSYLLDSLSHIQNTSRFVSLKMMKSLKKSRKINRQILPKFYRLLHLHSNNNKYKLTHMVIRFHLILLIIIEQIFISFME